MIMIFITIIITIMMMMKIIILILTIIIMMIIIIIIIIIIMIIRTITFKVKVIQKCKHFPINKSPIQSIRWISGPFLAVRNLYWASSIVLI